MLTTDRTITSMCMVTPYESSLSETFIRAQADGLPARVITIHGWRPTIGSQIVLCKLLTVEPHPGTYQMLTLNVKDLIREGRCRTLRAAVWGNETMLVGDFDEPEHYSAFAMREATSASGDELQTIGLSMPAIIAESEFETIDILKVDIEGAEVELFKGDLDWLRSVGAIAIEFHHDSRQVCFDEIMDAYQFR